MSEHASHPLVPDERPHGWLIMTLVVGASVLALPDVFDMGVFKTASLALLCAVVIVPSLAWVARDEIAGWFTSPAARLWVAFAAVAAVSAGGIATADVVDRILQLAVFQVAAVVGLLCAVRCPARLGGALVLAGVLGGLAALLQAAGLDTVFSPGPEEVVGLSGNSTRAGVLLGMALVALVARALGERPRPARDGALTPPRPSGGRDALQLWLGERLPLIVVSAGLVLTRARGARLATLAGLAALALLAWLRREDRAATSMEADMSSATDEPAARVGPHVAVNSHHGQGLDTPPPAAQPESSTERRPAWPVFACLLAGLAVAFALGGGDALRAHKLPDQAPILSGQDLTTNVRLALWDGTTDMVLSQPAWGHGLGAYRREFPPFRDPLEAALPGLGGAATEARHPHNELLLAAAEAGVLGGLIMVVLLLLTLRRALRTARLDVGAPTRVAFGVLVTGAVAALAQDAWTDPATAVPFFAALGFAWAPRPSETRHWLTAKPGLTVLLLLLGLGAGLLAWPRLDAQVTLRAFYEQAAADGINAASLTTLQAAAEASPGDIDIQRLLTRFAGDYARAAMPVDPARAAEWVSVTADARAAVLRLAPHVEAP